MKQYFRRTLLCLFFPLLWAVFSFAQPTVEAGFYNEKIDMFFLDDFDLSNPSANPPLFWIRITNDATDRNVTLTLNVESELYGLLASGTTKPFFLSADTVFTITNCDLAAGASPFELQDYTINQEAATELTNAILSTGMLPSDNYRFQLTLEDVEQPAISSQEEISVEITNPTTIELVSPGQPVGEGELPIIYTRLPQFVWDSNAKEFIITVCEKLPTNSSPEDVMDNEPRYSGSINSTNFLYPASGAWPLEPGKTYYWQVKAIVQSSSGTIELKSEIWGFTIGTTQSSRTSGQQTFYLNLLNDLLGEEVVQQLFSDEGELHDFTPTGVLLIDGSPATLQELQNLVQQIRDGKYKIKSFQITQ
ncbi:hypothetical protein DRQ00_01515 [candidate division KSB1 bacterium]|nr:hypothetical protein [bacterium]RKY77961.1 MAG: hypothetical protein DRQ12_07085 [candidate division KSB1 bacterium]RKY80788.1 MAG: hypothetical protein DRQ00_01515 [candidate division KSB1 bacterium]RKY87121.1 MAG: hypothetical protein DRQ11_07045 [candidate division KSB1 bacterium]